MHGKGRGRGVGFDLETALECLVGRNVHHPEDTLFFLKYHLALSR